MKPFDCFKQKGAIEVMMVLSEKGRIMTRQLLEEVECGQISAYAAVACLISIGLVEDERNGYRNRRWFKLTEKGGVVAEKLREIRGIVNSTVFVKPVLKDFSVIDEDQG